MNIDNIKQLSGGTQKDWDTIRKNTDQPIITIITSTYNVIHDLPWTMESIKSQTYPNIQWIVADGLSSDGTIELLQRYSDVIDFWFSNPDTGIYDAWNKALKHVKGDWVQFLGAGDELYEANTLSKVVHFLENTDKKYDLVYGKVLHISEKGRKELTVSGEPWLNYIDKWEGNRPALPVQTGIYHHKNIFLNGLRFETKYKITADSHLLLALLQSGKEIQFIDLLINKMPLGGISSNFHNYLIMYQETLDANMNLKIEVPKKTYYKNKLKYLQAKLILKIFNNESIKRMIDFKRQIKGQPKLYHID